MFYCLKKTETSTSFILGKNSSFNRVPLWLFIGAEFGLAPKFGSKQAARLSLCSTPASQPTVQEVWAGPRGGRGKSRHLITEGGTAASKDDPCQKILKYQTQTRRKGGRFRLQRSERMVENLSRPLGWKKSDQISRGTAYLSMISFLRKHIWAPSHGRRKIV